MKAAPLVLLMTIIGSMIGARGQDLGNFYLSSPANLSYVRENRLPVDQEQISDNVFLFSPPTLSFLKFTQRTEFVIRYSPEFEVFTHRTDLNSWNHSAGASYTRQFTPRLFFAVQNSYIRTTDPSRNLTDNVFLLPYGRFTVNSFGLYASYKFSERTTLNFSAENTLTSSSMILEHKREHLERMGTAGTVTIVRRLNERKQLKVSYTAFQSSTRDASSFFQKRTIGASGLTQGVHGAYRYFLDPGLSLELAAGIYRHDTLSYVVSGHVQKVWNTFAVAGGLSRQLGFFRDLAYGSDPARGGARFSDTIISGVPYDTATLRFRVKLGYDAGLAFRGVAGKNSVASAASSRKSASAHWVLYRKWGERLVTYVGADFYSQNVNDLLDMPMSRRRYYVGIAIPLSRPSKPADTLRKEQGELWGGVDSLMGWPDGWIK